MASYTRLGPADIDAIAATYGLRVRSVSPLTGGAANSSYLICADDRGYVLTVLDNHNSESALRLAALLDHLGAHDIPTSRPLRTRNGATVTWFAGSPVMVKEHIPGSCGGRFPAKAMADAGTLLARVHAVPVPDWLPRYHRRLPPAWPEEVTTFEDRAFVAWLREQYDMAAAALVAAYQTRRPLAELERRMLYRAVLYASLVIAYHRYRRHHLTHPDPTKQHLYREIPVFVDSFRVSGLAGITPE